MARKILKIINLIITVMFVVLLTTPLFKAKDQTISFLDTGYQSVNGGKIDFILYYLPFVVAVANLLLVSFNQYIISSTLLLACLTDLLVIGIWDNNTVGYLFTFPVGILLALSFLTTILSRKSRTLS